MNRRHLLSAAFATVALPAVPEAAPGALRLPIVGVS